MPHKSRQILHLSKYSWTTDPAVWLVIPTSLIAKSIPYLIIFQSKPDVPSLFCDTIPAYTYTNISWVSVGPFSEPEAEPGGLPDGTLRH